MNSVSEKNFYIESDEDHDEDKQHNADGSDTDSSSYSNDEEDDRYRSKPNSVTPSWPQSYRQSMDLYSSVPSPSLNFLGTPTLSRLSGSILSSARNSSEILPSLSKPFLPQVDNDQKPQERRSSYSLLPPIPSRRSFLSKRTSDHQVSKTYHEASASRRSSYGQAVLNGINVLCGVGILSTPYAIKEGGWAGLSVLVIFAVLSFYTGILLRDCLDSLPGIETYPDIGQAAFGTVGRFALSIILYVELYGCCIEYIILEGDNLSSLFPDLHLSLGGLELSSHHLFAVITTLTVLPTVWLRDLSVLSYISAGGVIASILITVCLFWIGLVDQVGFQSSSNTINLSTLPVAIGLYGYCYSGHAVFPNIYSSMEKPKQFPSVLLASFGFCALLYAAVAIMGYLMFGDSTLSQFTLNLPHDLVASKIAVWTTVVNPFTKYALTMTPVALCLEELIPGNHSTSRVYSILIRTALVLSTLIIGLCIPFFGLVMALIGSFLTMLVTLILPCACYLRILGGKANRFQISACMVIILVGVVSSGIGTYSAISKIIQNLS